MKKRRGLYPGTFDPLTLGHLDIIRRASRMVDELVIGVAVSAGKEPLFSLDERFALAEREISYVADPSCKIEVTTFDGLLVQFAHDLDVQILVRGLRAVSDFEYEFQMVGMNSQLSPDLETVFLMADIRYQPIASRLVKEIAKLGGDVTAFVSPNVAEALEVKFRI